MKITLRVIVFAILLAIPTVKALAGAPVPCPYPQPPDAIQSR
jgi:hypothetical protein